MTFFTFLDLCEGKRQKKGAYYLFFFGDKLVLIYYELIILGLILEALNFYEKKIWALFKKIRP